MAADFFLTDAYLYIPKEWAAFDSARRAFKSAQEVVQSVPLAFQSGEAWEKACERADAAQDVLHDAERAARRAFRRVFA